MTGNTRVDDLGYTTCSYISSIQYATGYDPSTYVLSDLW